MVAQDTTASPSYDPENLGAWDGQSPNPDLVDQLPPESPKPTAWPKVFDRLAWADGVVKSQRYRGATAAVFHRITTRSGTPEGCTESLGKMANGLGVTRKTVKNAVKTIRADGYILVEGHLRSTYVCVPDFDKGVGYSLPQGRVLTTPGGGVLTTPKRNSSSKGKLKKEVPGLVDAKRVDHVDHPGPEPGVTTGLNFSLWKKKGLPGPGPRITRLSRISSMTTSPKFQRTPRLSRWPSIAGLSGKSTGAAAGLLPGRPGPKTRLAERSSGKTLWPSSQRLVCLSQCHLMLITTGPGNGLPSNWTSS